MVQLYSHNASGLCGQLTGQRAEAWADLQDGIGRGQVGGVGDAGQVDRVDKEILAEGLFQVQL